MLNSVHRIAEMAAQFNIEIWDISLDNATEKKIRRASLGKEITFCRRPYTIKGHNEANTL